MTKSDNISDRLSDLVPLIERLADQTSEEGRHAMRGFLSLLGMTALLKPNDMVLVIRAMQMMCWGIGEPEEWVSGTSANDQD